VYRVLILLSMFFLMLACKSYSQSGPIKIFRYFDDFSYLLGSDSTDRKWYEKLKFIPFMKGSNVSIGGEMREMYQYFNNQNFGDVPSFFETDTEGFLWHRVMAHADFRLGKKWRLFTQLNSTFTFFKKNPLSDQIDENRLSLHQAFIRFDLNVKGDFIQVGRQEFGKGTQLIMGMREGPNTRLTFDALLFASEKKNRKIYSFIATPVISKTGVFDDERINEFIWALYMVNSVASSNIDLYYFGFHSTEREYLRVSGEENRQTIGLRLWKESKTVNFSLEAMYQFGSFNDLNISAYNISFLGDHQIAEGVSLGTMLNYISGDQDPQDMQLNTYNLLYSKPQFGLATPIGSTNIVNIKPFIEFDLFKKFKFIIGNYWIWRQSDEDGIYSPGGNQIRTGDNTISMNRFFGNQSTFEILYLLNANLQFFIDYAHFVPGGYVEETGVGETLHYFSLKTSFKF